MMDVDTAVRRAQVYRFLTDAFLYPSENWLEDLPAVAGILDSLEAPLFPASNLQSLISNHQPPTTSLQSEHRRAFGLTGSLCYETEYGLPHEFGQSQELADITGFYRAFGFNVGGPVRERPDHIAAELEFMHVLALKEACAAENGVAEHLETCVDAQRKFLQDHVGRWIGLFAEAVALNGGEGPYRELASLAAGFVQADAERLGLTLERRPLAEVTHTPLGPDLSCDGCAAGA